LKANKNIKNGTILEEQYDKKVTDLCLVCMHHKVLDFGFTGAE
jgi:hypothetical protein